MLQNPKILIIVPAFNEAGSIAALIAEIKSKTPNADIAVINDASTDKTEFVATASGAAVATLPHNLGIGGAVQTGYKIAFENNYDIAVQLDGDGQHSPEEISKIIQPLVDDKFDFCIGSRFLDPESDSFKSSWARRIGIRFFCRLLGLLTGLPLTDPTSGFRAVNKKLIQSFASYYPVDFPEPETIHRAHRLKFRVGEVSVKMRERSAGKSSIRYLKTFYYMTKVTLAILIDNLKRNKEE